MEKHFYLFILNCREDPEDTGEPNSHFVDIVF